MFPETILTRACLLSLALLLPGRAADQTDSSAALGPLPVGVTTTVLIDHGRTDALTQEPRTLVTEIWYPAGDAARSLPKNKYSDFLPGGATPEVGTILLCATGLISLAKFKKLRSLSFA